MRFDQTSTSAVLEQVPPAQYSDVMSNVMPWQGPVAPVRKRSIELVEQAPMNVAQHSLRQQLQAAWDKIESLKRVNADLDRQVDELSQQIQETTHAAYHDALTGLPNRSLLIDRLDQAIANAQRQRCVVALLFIDLVDFKGVNDRLGHAAGDQLLQEVALRLYDGIRAVDTACRYGGDEFVIVLPELDSEANAQVVVQKLNNNLARPFEIDGQELMIGASIGTAFFPGDGRNSTELLKKADLAMYQAKQRGRQA